MSLFEILRTLKTLSILLLIIFSVFLFTSKKEKNISTTYLALFMLTRAIMLVSFVSWDYFLVWKFPDFALMASPFLYLYCPLIYLYTKAQTNPSYRFRKYELLHFIPALLIFGFNFIYFDIRSFDTKIEMIKNGTVFYPVISWKIWMWLQLIGYGSLSVYMLNKYANNLKKYKSSIDQKKISWLAFLIYAFLIWKVIFITYYFANYITGTNHQLLQIVVEVFFLLYAIGIIYFSLQMPEIHFKQEDVLKYRTSPLTSSDKAILKNKVEQYFKTYKPFLDPEFDLNQLSATTNIPMHHLSQLFSEAFNQKFYDYCNRYRIEEVINLLSKEQNFGKTILELMFQAGFNSKSVFNNAFKKYMGMTPREYKYTLVQKHVHSQLN